MAEDEEGTAIFNRSMLELTRRLSGSVVAAYDFAGIRRIVDVGGGYGALLPAILEKHPDMRGMVFDLDSRLLVVEVMAPARLGSAPYTDAMITGSDINMLLMTGGRERTEAQYQALIEAAGLRVTRVVPTRSPLSVIEVKR